MSDLLPGTALHRDRVVPGLSLLDPVTGGGVSAWDFRHRRALVLCFVHPACRRCRAFLSALADREEDLRLAGGEVRAVVEAPGRPGPSGDVGSGPAPPAAGGSRAERVRSAPPAEGWPVSWLLDPGARVAAAYLGPGGAPPVVLVLDRYAAAWASYPAPGHRFPEPGEVVATLGHLAAMCPECGATTW